MAEGDFMPNEDMAIELGLVGESDVGNDGDDGDDGDGLGLGTGLSSGVRAISESEEASLPSSEAVGVKGGVEVMALFCAGCSGVDGSRCCFILASDFG